MSQPLVFPLPSAAVVNCRTSNGIPYRDWGGQGPPLHFAHANGFPPGTYDAFMARLSAHFRCLGMECRATWGSADPAAFHHWREMGDDLAAFLREVGWSRVLAVGHSLGAVSSLYCAVSHPELIGALVLIDPVIVPPWAAPFWALSMATGLNRRSGLAVGARRRRTEWPSREVCLRAYRAAPVFRRWQEPFLRDYVWAATEESAGGVRLRYPREWEARIFETPPPDVWCVMRRLRNLPVLVIRGALSDTYRPEAIQAMRWLLPRMNLVEVAEADHFVPMARPAEVCAALHDFAATLAPGTIGASTPI